MNNIKITATFIIIASLSTGCFDRMRSELLFEQYCNEEGRVGQFIYEKVELSAEYFRPIPLGEKELLRLDKRFYINDKKLLIDQQFY